MDHITFQQNSTTRMTRTNQFDALNRLTSVAFASASFSSSHAYTYNTANQRTRVDLADGSYWLYAYDALGQVVSGKRYWSNGTPVAGQQFEYGFDDIGNRKSTKSGGDQNGLNLRSASYSANLLNQYTNRTVPGYQHVLGQARTNATVTVNNQPTYRWGEYFRAELALNNQPSPINQSVTNLAVLNNGTNADILSTNIGSVFLPQTPEAFAYDADGNLTADGRWTYTWNGENRLIALETASGAVTAGKPAQRLEFAYDHQGRRIQKKVYAWRSRFNTWVTQMVQNIGNTWPADLSNLRDAMETSRTNEPEKRVCFESD